ncbi:hypothetical protein LTR87_013008 [Friedmanniomyces endolithicus]|nr:hypothetical protein LTR87_013008 [Friedmanniomyces endolithicus]
MTWSTAQDLAPPEPDRPKDDNGPVAVVMRKRPAVVRVSRRQVPIARKLLAPKPSRVELLALKDEAKPRIHRMPSSVDALLGAELVQTLSSMHLEDSWYAFVPSMLGENVAADAAARAVVRAHDCCSTPGTPTAVARCDSSYLAAINTLRPSLDVSDSALVAVGLLYLYESILKDTPVAFFSHARGISAILLARSRSTPVTPLTRAVLYGNTHGTFQEPVAMGISSPFDDPYWLEFEPAATYTMAESAVKLRRLANQTMIQLPGFIAKVRSLREDGTLSGQLLCTTTRLANEIYSLTSEGAESELLHLVALKETKDVLDKVIMRYSFEFKSFYEKETLLLYWGNRLMVIKLCLWLHRLHNKQGANGSPSPACTIEGLNGEQERLVMSILMCWQDGFDFVNPLSMVWGALMDRCIFRGKPVEAVRSRVWARYQDSLSGWPINYSMADMDEESDMLAGGPLTGCIAKQKHRMRGEVEKVRSEKDPSGKQVVPARHRDLGSTKVPSPGPDGAGPCSFSLTNGSH